MKKIGFIGAGSMAEAMVNGLPQRDDSPRTYIYDKPVK